MFLGPIAHGSPLNTATLSSSPGTYRAGSGTSVGMTAAGGVETAGEPAAALVPARPSGRQEPADGGDHCDGRDRGDDRDRPPAAATAALGFGRRPLECLARCDGAGGGRGLDGRGRRFSAVGSASFDGGGGGGGTGVGGATSAAPGTRARRTPWPRPRRQSRSRRVLRRRLLGGRYLRGRRHLHRRRHGGRSRPAEGRVLVGARRRGRALVERRRRERCHGGLARSDQPGLAPPQRAERRDGDLLELIPGVLRFAGALLGVLEQQPVDPVGEARIDVRIHGAGRRNRLADVPQQHRHAACRSRGTAPCPRSARRR